MALQTLKALWASGDKFPITTLTFNLTLGYKYNGQPWSAAATENKILRYALSQNDVTLDGEVYSASCFSAALPERSDNTFQDLTFSIGDVNREILQYLSRITRNDHKNLNYGANWFTMNLPLDNSDSVNTRTVRIKNGEIHKDLQFRNTSNFVYKVSFTLDVRE